MTTPPWCRKKVLVYYYYVRERRKLKVNVGKSKVMSCSRYGNGDRMHVKLNSEPLEEVDCFKYQFKQKNQWYEEVKANEFKS